MSGADYTPEYRRPIAGLFRATANGAVKICLKLNIGPDPISYFSMVFAACAAALFVASSGFPWMLWVAPVFCYLRLYCNMLDGMVAMASGKASHRGEILNEVPDRVSDVLIFVGVAHSGWAIMALGYWSAIGALFVAYVGSFGQAVGVHREFSGLMSKPWRMVVLHLGAWAAALDSLFAESTLRLGSLRVLDIALIVILVGCVQTAMLRLTRILRAVRERYGSDKPA